MKKTKKHVVFLGLCIAAVLCFGTAYAQDSYQYEAGVDYYTSTDDDDFEVRVYGIRAKAHFSQVNTSGHPLAEAAFLERIGDVELVAGQGDLEAPSAEGDVSSYTGSVTYMQPGSPITAWIMYDKKEIEADPPTPIKMTIDTFNIGIGSFLADGLRVGFNYGQEEDEIVGVGTTDYDDYEINVKLVSELGGGKAYNVEGSLGVCQFDNGTTDGSNTILSISGDYYFNERLSLGAGITTNSGDDTSEEGTAIALNLTNFFTPRFYGAVGYEKFSASDSTEPDEDSIDIMLSVRF